MIKNLRLHNFKCFEELEMELDKLTILSGMNGMGKSSILQSILLLQQSADSIENNQTVLLNGTYQNLGVGADILFENALKEEIAIAYDTDNGVDEYCLEYASNDERLYVINGQRQRPFKNMHLIYLAADRIIPKALYKIEDKELLKKREFDKQGEFIIQFLAEFGNDYLISNPKIILNGEKENITNRVQFFGEKIVISMPITNDNKTIYDVIKGWSQRGGKDRENYRYLITLLSKIQTNKYAPEPGKKITIDGISFLVPENDDDSILISIQSDEKFINSVLIGILDDNKEMQVANIAKTEHIWEHRFLLGMRIYEYNGKHSHYKPIPYGKGKISSVMNLGDGDAQELLNRAVYIDGKLCASKNDYCYVFMNHRDIFYHGFLEENPSDKIKRTLGLR